MLLKMSKLYIILFPLQLYIARQIYNMLVQQNSMIECSDQRQIIAAPVINKIDYQASKFRNLISQLRYNKKRSSGESAITPFQLQNQSQISNIEPVSQKYDKNSFQLDLQNDISNKRNTFTMIPLMNKQRHSAKQGADQGLKYRPRGSVNGRDDIRVRNLNQVHKKIVGEIQSHKKKNSSQRQNSNIQNALKKLDQMQNPQINNQGYFSSSKSRFAITTPKSKTKFNISSPRRIMQQQYHTQKNVDIHQNISRAKLSMPQNQNVMKIQAKQLLQYLQKKKSSVFPTQNSSPNKIYQFFIDLCSNFKIQDQFEQPLIKRYRNCIYFGKKVSKNQSYIGFVWYYRKALYYGEFEGGRKNGYGIQIDLEDANNECIWRGTFTNGKKTGYFQLISPTIQYHGSMVNSYFDGQGMLKIKDYSTYKGSFQAGMKHGFGVQNFINNKSLVYKGQYCENKFEGKGQLQGPNYYYKGDFRSSKPHGFGFERTNQFEYQGQFKNGKKSGRGTLKMKNGQTFEGIFQKGQLVKQVTFGNSSKINFKNTKLPEMQVTAPVINQYSRSIKIQSFQKNQQQASLSPSTILVQQASLRPPPSNTFKNQKIQQTYSYQKLNKNLNSRPSLNTFAPQNTQNKQKIKYVNKISNTISNINISQYSSRIIPLDKHLSKRLNSLYEQNQNQEGTIDPNSMNVNKMNNKNFGIFKMHKIQNQNNQHIPFNSHISRIKPKNVGSLSMQKQGYSDSEEEPLDMKVLPKE